MKSRKLLWLLIFVLVVMIAATVIALRVQNQRTHDRRREIDKTSKAVGTVLVPDTSPARFSR